jgi:hypothetical protein
MTGVTEREKLEKKKSQPLCGICRGQVPRPLPKGYQNPHLLRPLHEMP